MVPWNGARAKVQLRLAVQRLRILQEKKEAMAKSSRRDIATLIERGKMETARLRVEQSIHEDIHVELLELLEMYCELLLARFGILELSAREPDPAVSEAVNAVIYAAPRTEPKELHVLREILMHKYGRDYSITVMENRDNCVTDRVIKKLIMATPSAQLVNAYLAEIAKGYGIQWEPPADDDIKDGIPGQGGSPILSDTASLHKISQDNPKLPDIPPIEGSAVAPGSDPSADPPPPFEDDFTTLTKRFAALKKR